MNKKIITIFIISLLGTLICGAVITYPQWSHLLRQESFISDDKEIVPSVSPDITNKSSDAVEVIPEVEPIPSPTPKPFEEYDITLMAVGDNLMHLGLVNSGKQPDGTLNYDFLFEDISEYLQYSDISIINQETIMAGNELGFSGFPYFNSPIELADAIDKAGFNVVLQSSNHTIDQGLDGLLHACDVWSKHPNVLMVGINRDKKDVHDIPILTVKGKTFAILNYTYGPNLGAVPSDVRGHMNVLCKIKENSNYNELDLTTLDPAVLDDIRRADQMADIVIVCPHWGTEYATEPSSYQKQWAMLMTEAGADVIIGAHPHVPEPVCKIETAGGNSSLCYYSLGNYVSTGQEGKSMLEGMAWIVFHVTEDGISIDEQRSGVLPLVMQYLSGPLRFEGIYPLEHYTDELASHHGIRSWGGVNLTVDNLRGWCTEIFGEWTLSSDFILNSATP